MTTKKELLDQLSKKTKSELEDLITAPDRLKNWFRDQVLEYEGGCEEGKDEFLIQCGLKPDEQEFELSGMITFDGTDYPSDQKFDEIIFAAMLAHGYSISFVDTFLNML